MEPQERIGQSVLSGVVSNLGTGPIRVGATTSCSLNMEGSIILLSNFFKLSFDMLHIMR